MKANRLAWTLLLLVLGGGCHKQPATSAAETNSGRPLPDFATLTPVPETLPAQQNQTDRKLLTDIRTKAEKGDAQSQFELGNAFYIGSLGVAKDQVEAAKWYRRAAEQDLPEAQHNLGVSYADGQGVAKDEAEAAK